MNVNRLLCAVGVGCLCLLVYAHDTHATLDGDHSARPRPEYEAWQQVLLHTLRTPADPAMALPYRTTTTDFGKKGFFDLTEGTEPELIQKP